MAAQTVVPVDVHQQGDERLGRQVVVTRQARPVHLHQAGGRDCPRAQASRRQPLVHFRTSAHRSLRQSSSAAFPHTGSGCFSSAASPASTAAANGGWRSACRCPARAAPSGRRCRRRGLGRRGRAASSAFRNAVTKNSVGLSTETGRTIGSLASGIEPRSSSRLLPGERRAAIAGAVPASVVVSWLSRSRWLPSGANATIAGAPRWRPGAIVA